MSGQSGQPGQPTKGNRQNSVDILGQPGQPTKIHQLTFSVAPKNRIGKPLFIICQPSQPIFPYVVNIKGLKDIRYYYKAFGRLNLEIYAMGAGARNTFS